MRMSNAPILFCGDPHGEFDHIVEGAGHTRASAIVLLGDLEPKRALHIELAPLIEQGVPVWFIHGNHDADSDAAWTRVWHSDLADRNVHGRVVELPNGLRLAGLGGIFRKAVWYPRASAAHEQTLNYRSMRDHAKSTPRQNRWGGDGPPRKHWASIYPHDVEVLAQRRCDVLITHEAPGYHEFGFTLLDILARSMGAKVVVHGHQHDALDSSAKWEAQGFRSFGVGLRGITAIDRDGNAEVIVPGKLVSSPDPG